MLNRQPRVKDSLGQCQGDSSSGAVCHPAFSLAQFPHCPTSNFLQAYSGNLGIFPRRENFSSSVGGHIFPCLDPSVLPFPYKPEQAQHSTNVFTRVYKQNKTSSWQDRNLPCSSEPKPWVVLSFFLHTPSNITSDASTETGGVPAFLLSLVSNNCVIKSGTEMPILAILT